MGWAKAHRSDVFKGGISIKEIRPPLRCFKGENSIKECSPPLRLD